MQALNRRIALLDRLIIGVGVLALLMLAMQEIFQRWAPAPFGLPEPFAFMQDTTPPAPQLSLALPQATLRELSIAESCLVEGARLSDRGSPVRAELWFRRAVAVSHGHPRYVAALKQFEEHLDDTRMRGELRSLLRSGKPDDAWKLFSENARRDPRFFLAAARSYARDLSRQGHSSSAAVILQTYCRLKPEDAASKALLEQLTLALRREWEERKPWYDL